MARILQDMSLEEQDDYFNDIEIKDAIKNAMKDEIKISVSKKEIKELQKEVQNKEIFKCRLCGYPKYESVYGDSSIIPLGGRRYPIAYQCSGCSVIFKDFVKFTKKELNMDKELNKKMFSWISSSKTDESSITIWAVIMDIEHYNPSVPYDVYDFQRCYNLLKLCDETTQKITLKKLAYRYDKWKSFVEHWNKLIKLYEGGNMIEFNKLLTMIKVI